MSSNEPAFLFSRPEFRARDDIPCIRREYFRSATAGAAGPGRGKIRDTVDWVGWTIARLRYFNGGTSNARPSKDTRDGVFSNAFRYTVFGILSAAKRLNRAFSFYNTIFRNIMRNGASMRYIYQAFDKLQYGRSQRRRYTRILT